MKDPLKQGLKLIDWSPVSAFDVVVEVKDPLKQGLKQIILYFNYKVERSFLAALAENSM